MPPGRHGYPGEIGGCRRHPQACELRPSAILDTDLWGYCATDSYDYHNAMASLYLQYAFALYNKSNGQKTRIWLFRSVYDAVTASHTFSPQHACSPPVSPHALRNSTRLCISSAVRCAISRSRRRMYSPTEYCCCRARTMPVCDVCCAM